MDSTGIERDLSQLLLKTFPNINLQENLLSQIDSIALVETVITFESEFSIEIAASEINERNFADIKALSKWISMKVDKSGTRKP